MTNEIEQIIHKWLGDGKYYISEIKEEEIKELTKEIIELVEKHLMREWDKIESLQDRTTEEWRNFKFIRNTTRDIITKLKQ
jgi:hypothetical protein